MKRPVPLDFELRPMSQEGQALKRVVLILECM